MFFFISWLVFVQSAWAVPINCTHQGLDRYPINKDEPTVFYFIEDTASQYEDVIDESMRRWTEVEESYLTLTQTDDRDKAWLIFLSSGVSETTVPNYGGEVRGLDLGPDYYAQDRDVFIQKTMHETGHLIGMGHNIHRGGVMSVMAGSSPNLSVADKLSLARIYPVEDGRPTPVGCATVSAIDPNSGSRPTAAIMLMIFLAWLMARKPFYSQ